MEAARFERDEFVAERWDHKRGEHTTILGPTGWGKTTLAFDLLAPLSTPAEPTLVLAMKPRDKTVTDFGKKAEFRRVESWDPPPTTTSKWHPRRPAGWLLWPKWTANAEQDQAEQYHHFRKAIEWAMRRGGGIKVFGDELADLTDIGLKDTVSHSLRQGRSLDQSMFCASQRPSGIPVLAYGQAMHLFIGNDTDKRNRDRYGEIGGVDKDLVIGLTSELAQHEWLYIRRARGKTRERLCIVGP